MSAIIASDDDMTALVAYYVTDESGKVLRYGKCPRGYVAKQATGKESAVEGEPPFVEPEPDHKAQLIAEQAVIDGESKVSVESRLDSLEARLAALEGKK